MRRAAVVRALALAVVFTTAGSSAAHACQNCFGAEEANLVAGSQMGVWALLAVTVCMQLAFAGFFIYLRRRARLVSRMELAEEWEELQHTTRSL